LKNKKILIALLFFTLPIIGRILWFYQGIYFRNSKDNSPEYENLTIPLPALSTPALFAPAELEKKVTVLIDQSHGNLFTVAEIEPLYNDLILRGVEILIADTESDFEPMLRKSDALIVITPTDPYTSEEIEDVEEFVARRGKMLVIADPTRSDRELQDDREETVIQTNQLLQPFLISFNNDYVYNISENEGNFRNVFVYPAGYSELTKNLTSLVFYGAHSVATSAESVIEGDQKTLSSLTDAGGDLPVSALDETGNVLVIGDLTFMTNPFYQVADNNQFIQNITDFLVNSFRVRNFSDFPDLFTRDLGIILSEGITLDKDLLEIMSNLQRNFALDDISVTIFEESTDGFDEVILGIYPPGEELKTLTDAIGFYYSEMDQFVTATPPPEEKPLAEDTDTQPIGPSGYFTVPEFGSIPSEGFGFLMINQTDKKIQLVLLAESQENCINLLKLIEMGSLERCLVGKNIAVCEQYIKVNHYYDQENGLAKEDLENDDDLINSDLEPESTPEATPTPNPTETEQP
jgi:hypothetical protein